ncbi:hypothetical protein BGZ65_009467 [Modicella reniformis]|uniref:polynucleotide adenylyltransferase n=1 Tax=Modicella reniformis TaxID=1440133 RepID=A0A9P6MAZ0_9FUNG|nr:hypothetical protein BGZ65_009467 [Modicella reniformis]
MNHLAILLKDVGQMKDVKAVPDAMVPIVKFQDPETEMECDLNTGNSLGVINSELIKIYTEIDERESQSSPSGTVWGWGSKAILPKLQVQPFERMKEITVRVNHNTKNVLTSTTSLVNSRGSDMVHCRYDDNKDYKHTGSGRGNRKTLARLLIEFFEFFSRRFNYVDMAIHVSRGQLVKKSTREMHNENSRQSTFRVVDPFLHHRNITGTCRGETLARVWRAFDHSYRMLSAGDLKGAMVTVE